MVRIRTYKNSDYEGLKKALMDGKLYNLDCDSRKNVTKKIKENKNSIIVAEINGEVCGCVYIVAEPWCAFIFRLAVRKKYRNSGVGSLLLNEAEKRLRKTGVKWVSVFVEDSKKDLKGFYSKRNYSSAKIYMCMDKDLHGDI